MDFSKHFNGLTMPVFTAFGWAGEETAIKYALSQLELFVETLHGQLPRAIQTELPFYGMSEQNQSVYLASAKDVDSDVHLSFYARPLSLEMQLVIIDKKVLNKGLTRAVKNPANSHHLMTALGPEWSLRVQQMQIDEESGVASHYQDLFKDSLQNLDQEAFEAVINKAMYLNSEEQWVTPLYLSRRFESEQVSVMGVGVTKVMSEHITALMPVLMLLSGRTKKKARKAAKAKSAPTKTAVQAALPEESVVIQSDEDGFTYIAELKPLHIRRGFVNLTPQHWPFFALNARTETRKVTIYYNGIYDKKSTVWRLQPTDQARIVLSPVVHDWLEENFSANNKIQVVGRKLENNELQISLTAVS